MQHCLCNFAERTDGIALPKVQPETVQPIHNQPFTCTEPAAWVVLPVIQEVDYNPVFQHVQLVANKSNTSARQLVDADNNHGKQCLKLLSVLRSQTNEIPVGPAKVPST